MIGIKQLVIDDLGQYALLAGHPLEHVESRAIGRRAFHQHVLAGVKGGSGGVEMPIVGRGDADDIDVRGCSSCSTLWGSTRLAKAPTPPVACGRSARPACRCGLPPRPVGPGKRQTPGHTCRGRRGPRNRACRSHRRSCPGRPCRHAANAWTGLAQQSRRRIGSCRKNSDALKFFPRTGSKAVGGGPIASCGIAFHNGPHAPQIAAYAYRGIRHG